MKEYWQSLRQMERSAALYLVVWAVIFFGYFGVQAVLLNLYLLKLGFDSAYIGNFLAGGQLIWAICGLPAGMIGVRFGLRASLVGGLALIATGWTVLLLAELLPSTALSAGLLTGWMISWVGASLITVNGLPYQMAVTTDANRSYVFSFQQAIQATFALLGGLVAGVLPGMLVNLLGGNISEAASYRAVLWLLPVTHLFAMLAIIRARSVSLIASSSPDAGSGRVPLGIFAFFSLIVLFQSAGEGGVRQMFNLYLHERVNLSTGQIGTIFGLSQLAPLIAALLMPLMLKRMSTGSAVWVGTLLMTSAILILTISSTLVTAAAGMFSILLTSSILNITRSMFSQEIVPPRWRPMTSALSTIFMALGWAGSAAFGGRVVEQSGFNDLFRAAAVLVTLAGLITVVFVSAAAVRSRRAQAAAIPITGENDGDVSSETGSPAAAETQP